jgi:hypothetical protein
MVLCFIFLTSCGNKGSGDDSVTDLTLPPPQPISPPPSPKEVYPYFFNYRLEKFAPDTEPLIAQTFGSELSVKEESLWEYESYNSLAIGFSVGIQAISAIEYGKTPDYGSRTEVSESYYFNHLHYIKDLEPGTTYYYRIIIQDHNANAVALPGRYLTTKNFTDKVVLLKQSDFVHYRANGESCVEGTVPGVETRSGLCITSPGVYVLTQDVTTDGLGVNIKASDVTIDLNGHTLTYDNDDNVFANGEEGGKYNESDSYGIRSGLWNKVNIKIYNGIVKQGLKGSPSLSPLYIDTYLSTDEVAGVTVDYYGDQTSGMLVGYGQTHHNILYDRGSGVDDRHGAVRALEATPSPNTQIAYNSFRRIRQRGIDQKTCYSEACGFFVHDNELYVDSFAVNSFVIGVGDNAVITNNKIFGMGDSPIGIGWGNNIRVADNFIYMRCFSPEKRFEEYERKSSVAGMRVTDYGDGGLKNLCFERNTIALKAEDYCSFARGIWTINGVKSKNIVYRDNIVKVEALPGNFDPNYGKHPGYFYNGNAENAVTPVSVNGQSLDIPSEEIPTSLLFEDNRLIANVNHITLGEGYGIANGARFYRTTLEKIAHDSDHKFYAPVRIGFWYLNSMKNLLIDTKLIGVTKEELNTPYFYGDYGKMEIFYGIEKTLTFNGGGRPIANQTIRLYYPDENTQDLTTDENGVAIFDLLSARHYKWGNSQEDGVSGEASREDYKYYIFKASGWNDYAISIDELKAAESITLQKP